MTPFYVVCSSGMMSTHVSFHNRPMLSTSKEKFEFRVRKILCLDRCRYLCSSISLSFCSYPSYSSASCGKTRYGSNCNKKIRSQISRRGQENMTQLENRVNSQRRKRFSLRLRPRLRLFSIRLKWMLMKLRRVSIQAMVEGMGELIRKNLKKVTLTTAVPVGMGLCYLLLKLSTLPSPKVVPYSDLITNLQGGNVSKVLFEEGSRRIFYNTISKSNENSQLLENDSSLDDVSSENSSKANAKPAGVRTGLIIGSNISKRYSRAHVPKPEWQFSTRKIDHDENFLLTMMREKGTTYSSAPQSALVSIRGILFTVLSLWIPLMPLMWLLYRQLSTANSPAKKRQSNNQSVSFDDVEGVSAAKTELLEVVMCLQGAINYNKLGAKLPRGVLLVGPPGTGKTLLARAVAGEAGVPFFTVSASEFVEMFVGRGAARIRDLFNIARKCSPSIIFIDELDAVGGKRGRSFNDERDQTLNQLLTEMDGFESDMKVVVIAATNRPEALDPALCRPGRFSRKVFVGEPDTDGRRKILAVHFRGVPLEEDPQLICNLVASLTPGFVGADLANIVNEAALLAARRGGEKVSREDIMAAIERAKFGINDRQLTVNTIGRELGRLFSWMPSPTRSNDPKEDGLQGPMGYQTLS